MPLSTLLRPEKWNSEVPVSSAILRILPAFTPHPGMMMIRPSASSTNSFKRGIPFSAVASCPEVRTRSIPRPIICSKASLGLLHISKARWKVTLISPTAFISFCIKGTSTLPSAVRHPNTTPSAPNWRATLISCNMISCSMGEYRKSPPRGRIMTCSFVWFNNWRAIRISPKDGVVPPSGIPAHSSTR